MSYIVVNTSIFVYEHYTIIQYYNNKWDGEERKKTEGRREGAYFEACLLHGRS